MNATRLVPVVISAVTLSVLLYGNIAMSSTFPFRSVSTGDKLPDVTLTDTSSNQPLVLNRSNSKNALIVFWGADNASKKKRVIKTLKTMSKLQGFIKENGVTQFVVNAANDSPDIISEVMSAANLSLPVYVDSGLEAYKNLGIFVMPSILILDKQGKIVAGMGYSKDLKTRLKGEIEIMLGIKDRAQLEHELRPRTVEKSPEEKKAKRHLHQGQAMAQRGQAEVAIREFKKAAELVPDMSVAHIRLGCLYIEVDQISLAKEALARGLEGIPDSLDGKICQARIKAREGAVDEAIDDLQFLLLRNSRDPDLHYIIATLLVKQGKLAESVEEYDIAFNLLKKINLHN